MAVRSSWKGYLKLSLVSVPVQAVNAQVSGGGEIHFHQLHAKCHSRIRYQKVCPIHGEVPNDEIVSGYEYAKGKYTIVDTADLDKLRSEGDRAITIEAFIAPEKLDALYLDGRNYYLLPDTPVAQKPYAVLYEALQAKKRHGIARVVFSGKEQLVLLRPLRGLLLMSMLQYASRIRPAESLEGERHEQKLSRREVHLAEMLIDASTTTKFDFSKYEDLYTERLTELINAKIAGREVVASPHEDEAPVINLMDALKQSLGKAKKTGAARSQNGTPSRKMAISRRHVAARHRKSS